MSLNAGLLLSWLIVFSIGLIFLIVGITVDEVSTAFFVVVGLLFMIIGGSLAGYNLRELLNRKWDKLATGISG